MLNHSSTLPPNVAVIWAIKKEVLLILHILIQVTNLTQAVFPTYVHPTPCLNMQAMAATSKFAQQPSI